MGTRRQAPRCRGPSSSRGRQAPRGPAGRRRPQGGGPKQADTRGRRKQCLTLPRHGACVSTDGASGVRFHPNVEEPGMQTGNTFCSRSPPTSGKQAPPGVDHSVDAASPGASLGEQARAGSGVAPLSRPPRCPQHTPLTVRWGSHGYHMCTPFPSCHRWMQVSSCAAAAWQHGDSTTLALEAPRSGRDGPWLDPALHPLAVPRSAHFSSSLHACQDAQTGTRLLLRGQRLTHPRQA